MTTYATTKTVPPDVDYLTPGREYIVDDNGLGFFIFDDLGRRTLCRWSGCALLDGGDWDRVERD